MSDPGNDENDGGNGHPKTLEQRVAAVASNLEALAHTVEIHSRVIHLLRDRIEILERRNAN